MSSGADSEPQTTWIGNRRGLKLAATHFEADPVALVIMTHGFMSERTSRGRSPRIAASLAAAGYSVLTLDFAGSGLSDDEPLRIANQVDDLRDVIHYTRDFGYQHISLWGHSLGARVALQAADPEILTIISVGGVTGGVAFDPADRFNPAQLDELERTGYLTEPRKGPRARVVVDGDLFTEFSSDFDCSQVLCPVLCIHGDADPTERGLGAVSRERLSQLPKGSRLEVLEGADHTFMSHLNSLVDLGLQWLRIHMPLEPGG